MHESVPGSDFLLGFCHVTMNLRSILLVVKSVDSVTPISFVVEEFGCDLESVEVSETEMPPEMPAKTNGSAADGSVSGATVGAGSASPGTSARADYIITSRGSVRARGRGRSRGRERGAGASAVLLLLTKVQALLGSAAEVLEVEKEELVLLVVGMLLVIPVKIMLTQASLLILSVLDPLLLVMTSLVAVAVLEVNRTDWELVLHVVVAKLALLTGIYLTLALLLLVLFLPHR